VRRQSEAATALWIDVQELKEFFYGAPDSRVVVHKAPEKQLYLQYDICGLAKAPSPLRSAGALQKSET